MPPNGFSMALTFNQAERDGVIILELSGRLVYGTEVDSLSQEVKWLLGDNKSKIVLDFENVTYCDSSGLGCLASVSVSIRNQGGEVAFVHPSERVKKLLEVTRMNTVFQIFESIDDALASIK